MTSPQRTCKQCGYFIPLNYSYCLRCCAPYLPVTEPIMTEKTYLEPRADVFALRSNERITCLGMVRPVPSRDRVLGLIRRSVSFPDSGYVKTSSVPETKGMPVMMEAILACEHTPAGWVWVQLSPSTKEQIGSLLEKWNAPIDEWVYCGFSQDSDQ